MPETRFIKRILRDFPGRDATSSVAKARFIGIRVRTVGDSDCLQAALERLRQSHPELAEELTKK